MPKLHGVNASPFVRKVRVVLAEKGIEYELNPVMPMAVSDEFRKISPLGKIPCWEDGAYTLPDSSCICAYLERKHPEPALYPRDPELLGRVLWYEEYGDTRLSEAIGNVFFQRIVQGRILKQEPDEEVIRRSLEEMIPMTFDYLEVEAPDGEAIVGDRLSVADITLAGSFVNLFHAGETLDADRWPRLAAYVDRTLRRPSFASLIEEERAAFSSL